MGANTLRILSSTVAPQSGNNGVIGARKCKIDTQTIMESNQLANPMPNFNSKNIKNWLVIYL